MSPRAAQLVRLAGRVVALLAGMDGHRRHAFILALQGLDKKVPHEPWRAGSAKLIMIRPARTLRFLSEPVCRV